LLAHKYHPDISEQPLFKEITEAYAVLKQANHSRLLMNDNVITLKHHFR